MENCLFPLICYWDGNVVVNGDNVEYVDGKQDFLTVRKDISYSELISGLYEVMELDVCSFELEVKMKYPILRGGFRVLPLKNDRALESMWASVSQSKAPQLDLYIEVKPIHQNIITQNPSSFPINTSFTSMISNVERWVSLSNNNVDTEGFEDDDNLEDEDVMLMNEVDGEDSDGDLRDIVSSSAPNVGFTKVPNVDEELVNNWCNVIDVPYVDGGEFCKGQRFANRVVLANAVTSYHVSRNQICYISESRSYTITYKCGRKPKACHWCLRATQKDLVTETFTIVTYKGPHHPSCVGLTVPLDHPNMRRAFISRIVKPLVEADWGVKVNLLRESIKTQYGFTISYMKAWHSKQRAIADIFGDWEESYDLLPRYLNALKEANPGTVVHFQNTLSNFSDDVEQFDRVFWAFGPCIRGFEHCRPLISIDGTHLYGKYKGVLLIAVAVDGNDQIYPLAFAIVDKESNDTWAWFMACIRNYVTRRVGLCVISDRHQGIMHAMSSNGSGWEEPYAYHRYCIRHHASNIKRRFKSADLKEQFVWTAFQNQVRKFKLGMEKIGIMDSSCKTVLENTPLSKWSMAHDDGRRYGLTTTNMSECFNGVLKGCRFLPITSIVETTFYRLNSYFVTRRNDAKSRLMENLIFSPKITEKLNINLTKAGYYKVTCYNIDLGIYEVVTARGTRAINTGNHGYTVVLSRKTCTCNKWQLYHYPCSHLMAVCRSISISYEQFVDPCYTTEHHYASYRPNFVLVPDKGYWKPWMGAKLIPNPTLKRGGGRPMSKRIRNEMDEKSSSKNSCSLCHNEGHNKRSCPMRGSSSTS